MVNFSHCAFIPFRLLKVHHQDWDEVALIQKLTSPLQCVMNLHQGHLTKFPLEYLNMMPDPWDPELLLPYQSQSYFSFSFGLLFSFLFPDVSFLLLRGHFPCPNRPC